MRIDEQNLDSLRKIVRELQQENEDLKALLKQHQIAYESKDRLEAQPIPDDFDEDQGARILPLDPTEKMANVFFGYFWGRKDVYARRWKNGGYFPQCSGWRDNPLCPKKGNPKVFCDEDCKYKSWSPLELCFTVHGTTVIFLCYDITASICWWELHPLSLN